MATKKRNTKQTKLTLAPSAFETHLAELAKICGGLYQLGASIEQGDVAVSCLDEDLPFTLLQKYTSDLASLPAEYDSARIAGQVDSGTDAEEALFDAAWIAKTLASLTAEQQPAAVGSGFLALSNRLSFALELLSQSARKAA